MTEDDWIARNGLTNLGGAVISMIQAARKDADRAAREECAEICDELQKGFLEVGASSIALGALNCRKAIRETITGG